MQKRSTDSAQRARRKARPSLSADTPSKWTYGLPEVVEEALVNALPQEDAMRLRLVSSHWAR